MKRVVFALSLMFGITAHAGPFDFLQPNLRAWVSTPKNRAMGSMMVGGGGALILGISGFPVAALAAVVCGGVGFTHYCVQGVTPNLQDARRYLEETKVAQDLAQQGLVDNQKQINQIHGNIREINSQFDQATTSLASHNARIDQLSLQAQQNHVTQIDSIQARIAQVQAMQVENDRQIEVDQAIRTQVAGHQKTLEELIAAGQKLGEEQKQQLQQMQKVNVLIIELVSRLKTNGRLRSNSRDSLMSSVSAPISDAGSVRSSLTADTLLSAFISPAIVSMGLNGRSNSALGRSGSQASLLASGGASPRDVLQQAAERAQVKLPKVSGQ